MNDWHTYRNGNPRQPWDLERLARHRAAKLGHVAAKVLTTLGGSC
jgi:hypothetical protein